MDAFRTLLFSSLSLAVSHALFLLTQRVPVTLVRSTAFISTADAIPTRVLTLADAAN